MKKRLSSVTVGLVGLALVAGLQATANAAVVVTAKPVGADVVFSSTGSLDLTGLPFSRTAVASANIWPTERRFTLGIDPGVPLPIDVYALASALPVFGDGATTDATSGSGPRWGVNGIELRVPRGYTSGRPLESTLVFAGATFASLGLTPGTYTASWSSDSITLKVVPVPAALPLLCTALAGLGVMGARRRRKTA